MLPTTKTHISTLQSLIKLVTCIFLSVTFFCSACNSSKYPSYPVYFTADSKLFKDSTLYVQTVWHDTLDNFIVETVLKDSDVAIAWIKGPTIIHKGRLDQALVFPGEQIHITGDSENEDFYFSIAGGSAQRNRELQVLKAFILLQNKSSLPREWLFPLPEYNLDKVLEIEQKIKVAIPVKQAESQRLFESLLISYDVSPEFKSTMKQYAENSYDYNLLLFYRNYKDTLTAHGLYQQKLRDLAIPFNAKQKNKSLSKNAQKFLNELLADLFPKNKLNVNPTTDMFRVCFDSIQNNFSGFAKEHLLSQLMVRAYMKGIAVPAEYVKRYNKISPSKEYRRDINIALSERKKKEADTITVSSRVSTLNGKTVYTLDELMAQFKGNYIVVDCWASWCMPCIMEMPYLIQLKEEYANDNIVFLNLSFDKHTASLIRLVNQRNMLSLNHYILLNASKSAFTRQYNIGAIPRYLLFDKEGNMINDNLPPPSNPAFKQLLDSLAIKKNL